MRTGVVRRVKEPLAAVLALLSTRRAVLMPTSELRPQGLQSTGLKESAKAPSTVTTLELDLKDLQISHLPILAGPTAVPLPVASSREDWTASARVSMFSFINSVLDLQ